MEQIDLKELYKRIDCLAKPKFGSVKGLEIATEGLKESVIQKWKSHFPSADKLFLVAQALDVSMEYLLTGESTTNSSIKKKKDERQVQDKGEFTVSDNPRDVMSQIVLKRYKMDNFGEIDIKVQSQCPICHYHIVPKPVTNYPVEKNNPKDRVVVFWCSHCSHIYSVLYKDLYITPFNTVAQLKNESFQLPAVDSCYTPYRSAAPDLPETFNKPEFAKFKQAYEDLCWAKDYQIEGLVGMAYRRALEYLIKDFLISKGYISEYKDIPKENLANLILSMDDNFVDNCSYVVNKLSNDYVHYEDEHPERNHIDIAKFFEAVLKKIGEYLVNEEALNLFDPKSKKLQGNKAIKNISLSDVDKLAEEYKKLWEDDSFIKTAKLFNEIDSNQRLLLLGWIVSYFVEVLHIDTYNIIGH